MDVKIVADRPVKTKNLLIPFFKDQYNALDLSTRFDLPVEPNFTGDFKEVESFLHPTRAQKIYLLGLGKMNDLPKCHEAFRHFVFKNRKFFSGPLHLDLMSHPDDVVYEAVLGSVLATYEMGMKKTSNKKDSKKLVFFIHHQGETIKDVVREARESARTQMEMMTLVNSPANIKTPKYLAKYVKKSAKQNGFEVRVFNEKELKENGFHAILAVGQGSRRESVLIQMEYRPAHVKNSAPQLGLVGKGVTFDTGGVSMKSPTNMHYMKSDMGGAAAVIGAIELAAKLRIEYSLGWISPCGGEQCGCK